ncbi:DUF4252 domain-containing protein [Zhouia sp. PK063]|uniref:DUF4252 domain-containing protein n=1 Tax=Zhouia sp. PK063 TaxID=3373602 RepID=UPI0037AEC4E5
MKKLITLSVLALVLAFSACSKKESIQEFYVKNSENPDYLAVDIPMSLFKGNEASFSAEQQKAFNSVNKLNVLVYPLKTGQDTAEFDSQKEEIKEVLSNDDYEDLVKINNGNQRGVIKVVGDGDAVDEIIIYGYDNSKGLALIRVLGNDMNPKDFMTLAHSFEKGDLDSSQFENIAKMFGK